MDTSILVDHLRGDHRAHELLSRATRSRMPRLAASVMTKVEIMAGMRQGEEAATRGLLALVDWIPVSEDIAERAGELAHQYFRSHAGVDPVHFVIAATAESLDAELWTRNLKHFPMFPGLGDPYIS